jgi:SAM-dependent methyltransferase
MVQPLVDKDGAERAPGAGFLFGLAPLEIFSIQDSATFQRLFDLRLSINLREQEALLPPGYQEFRIPGLCVICGKPSLFMTDYQYAGRPDANGKRMPSWRERQICACAMNCRQRSCFHVLTQLPRLTRDSNVYCTEQGALFQHIRRAFHGPLGSEYLGSRVPLGQTDANGVRNEDLTRLTFADRSFDCIFSLDVLEHVPDYRAGLREMARCLRPGGWLLMTTPIHFDLNNTVTRATLDADGNIVHHLPPVYHGDPIDSRGVLCFHDFGWDLLSAMNEAGFADSELTIFTAPHYGYIGLQYVLLATREERETRTVPTIVDLSSLRGGGR